MNIGRAIFSALTSDATVSGMVGSRIYPALVPDKTQLPQVVYREGDDLEDPSFDGKKLPKFDVHVVSVAADYDTATALADAVANVLDEGEGTWGGITVLGCWLNTSEKDEIYVEGAQDVLACHTVDQTYELRTRS